jgi:5'-3' exonuclease
MGIQELMQYLKKLNPDIVKKSSLSKFYNKRIGVDAYYWLYSHVSIAQKGVLKKTNVLSTEPDRDEVFKILMQSFFDFYIKMQCINIQCVLCFDGSSPIDKLGTLQRRTASKNKIRDKISTLEAKLEGKDILEKNETDAEALRNLKSQLVWVSKEEINKFRNIAIKCGIPCLQCTTEGEKMCAMLMRDGITAATLGKDSDLSAYGNRFILSEIRYQGETIDGTPKFTVMEVDLVDILTTLELNYKSFVDFCIMLGTDYGIRIKKVGPVTSHKLIKTHKTLDEVKLDLTCLNHIMCRSEFGRMGHKEIVESGSYEIGSTDEKVIEELKEIGLSDYYEKVSKCHSSIQITDADKEINNQFENLFVEVKPKIKIVIKK